MTAIAKRVIDPRADMIRFEISQIFESRKGKAAKAVDLVATQRWVGQIIELGRVHGYNLMAGDIALVDPEDPPKFIRPLEGVDPVYLRRGPDVLPGRTLFVRKQDAARFLADNNRG